MTDQLRPLILAIAFTLLAACTLPKPGAPLGDLPRTPQATTEQLLEQAANATPEQAAQLRLTAASQSVEQGNAALASRTLDEINPDLLKPADQLLAQVLRAETSLRLGNNALALEAINHPSFKWLQELPEPQQVRAHLTRAATFEANGQTMTAIRERTFVAPLLSEPNAGANHEAIWRLVSGLPNESLVSSGDPDLDGWMSLVATTRQPGTLAQQQGAIDAWRQQHPNHPAAQKLPEPLAQLRAMDEQPLERVALLLPLEGQLASVAGALRDGFLAAHLQASQQGIGIADVRLYDASKFASLDLFYQQAQADGVQLVIGPLDKTRVRELGNREALPITTLALNYTEPGQPGPTQLFQFGLAAEDEAREAAERAWEDGHRNAIALVPRGEWGERVLDAFRQHWLQLGGTLVAADPIAEPVDLANQVASLLRLHTTAGSTQPTRRQDVDFLFLAATPQQAQQVKPILVFHYAGDLPVYATSHLHSATGDRSQYLDLEGIRFTETPWLLDANDPLRQQVQSHWPQAGGSLGRLYAMGADAYLLATRLSQLQAFPGQRLHGLSGDLRLNSLRRVERSLPWAEFRSGEVIRLDQGQTPADAQ